MVFFFNPYPKNIKYKQKDQKQGNRVFNLQIIHMIQLIETVSLNNRIEELGEV